MKVKSMFHAPFKKTNLVSKFSTNLSKMVLLSLFLTPTLLGSANAKTITGNSNWASTSSERLVKLPPNYMKKSVDRDFEKSGLAAALYRNQDSIRLKIDTLRDIQSSVTQTDDQELKTELKHQYLAEKQAYLELVAKDQKFRRKRTETKLKLYENLLRQLNHKKSALSPQKAKLLEQQVKAKKRFNATIYEADKKLFQSGVMEESKYSRDYAKNANAIHRLVQAIKNHPSSELVGPHRDGQSKSDFIRHLIHGLEANLAILDQENQILGYMAKVVSLDARALAESLPEIQATRKDANKPLEALEFFIN